MFTQQADSSRISGVPEPLKAGGDWIWEKLEGRDQIPPPPNPGDHYLPRHPHQFAQSPFLLLLFRKVSEAPAEVAYRPTGLMVEAAPACPSPPPSGSARHRSGGNCSSGCSSDSVLSAPSSSQFSPASSPPKGTFSSVSLLPFHHFYTPETPLPLLLLFTVFGLGRPQTLGPKAGGRDLAGCLLPRASLCLGQEAKDTGLGRAHLRAGKRSKLAGL